MSFIADHSNVEELLTLNAIGGLDIKDILKKEPRVSVTPHQNIVEILDYMKKFKIEEKSVTTCLSVLQLNSNIFYNRLKELDSKNPVPAKRSPEIMRVICNKLKVDARLDYLNQFKKECDSVSVLTDPRKTLKGNCFNTSFVRLICVNSSFFILTYSTVFLAKTLKLREPLFYCDYSHQYTNSRLE